ncbi:hypothetical protein [Streptomyces natalensis]|uniref:Uncharacterized protein n=1 Tax=Streptomyces natalensis ATCC 27448 TaxID=1240678 RepID=A0A0D7CIY8_9ACTN|nr:hypothetical protein [Streptomyces natalensis]KIZ15382.1 hypothetical protein SNA_27915 [Streptomyces natalensis ATCC 27448]
MRAYAVNHDELNLIARRPDGWRPGQDVAGLVVQTAADGSGPAIGPGWPADPGRHRRSPHRAGRPPHRARRPPHLVRQHRRPAELRLADFYAQGWNAHVVGIISPVPEGTKCEDLAILTDLVADGRLTVR